MVGTPAMGSPRQEVDQLIKFSYKDALDQARELDQVSEDLYRLTDRILKPKLEDLGMTWKGDSAQIFLRKTEEVLKDMRGTADTIARISNGLEGTAKTIKAAEDAAKQLVAKKS